MRLKIKKDIKSMIQSMLKAHDYVIILLQSNQIAKIREILGQCQDCAAYIGKTIEKNEGMGTQAVSYLEMYCEQVYRMSITREKKKLIKLKGMSDDSLYKVEQEVDRRITLDRPKIVFMPYKASMWDCMESVWEAAEADKECDTYVVPIPYYERNSKGDIEKSCYEGGEFPKYVPIVPYEEFSLENEKPDIIYIHNPYDASNYVTSVYPEYYSSNLNKYTDVLVYIPYFIYGSGPFPEMHRELPAYLYVNKIIVQDKEKAESLSDRVPEENVVVLGSPKVDRLLKLNKQKQTILENDIPQLWKEKIKNKKVVLFNVSISGILQNSDYALDKIRYVLSLFKNREDVVLLWRPHPLIEATLKSMRPEMYNEYIKIKGSFIKAEKGIFDETGDAGIAAVVADAYLGERSSSLVHYFGIMGKPVFYINWKTTEEKQEDRRFLSFNNYFIEENNLFFVPINKTLSHDLYKMDLKEGIAEKIMSFPGTADDISGCYCGIKKVEGKIVLIPSNAEDIYVYDMKKRQAIKIVLSESKDRSLLFNDAVEYNGKLFFIPECYPAIVSLDIETLDICEYKECIKPFLTKDNSKILFVWSFTRKQEYLYLASCNDNRILIFNMENRTFEIERIGNYPYGFGHMAYDGKHFWLTAYTKNCVVRWEEHSGDTREYDFPMEEGQPIDGIWSLVLDNKEEIIICPGFSTNMIFINKETGMCHLLDVRKKIKDGMKIGVVSSWEGFMSANFLDKQTLIFSIWKNRSINLWNTQENKWKSYLCRLPVDEMLKSEKRQIERNWIARSEPYSLSENMVSISQFIDYIVGEDTDIFRQKYSCYQMEESDCSIGEKVHNYIKSGMIS